MKNPFVNIGEDTPDKSIVSLLTGRTTVRVYAKEVNRPTQNEPYYECVGCLLHTVTTIKRLGLTVKINETMTMVHGTNLKSLAEL